MKRLSIFFLILLGLLSCNSNRSTKEKFDSVDSQMGVDEVQEILLADTQNLIEPDYDVAPCVFDDLPSDSKVKFIHDYKCKFDNVLLRYYDRYATIYEIDTIFEILSLCDFSTKANKESLSFYIHVLFELMKNTHIDGYVGEAMVDACYTLFNNYPGVFYQHTRLLERNIQQIFIDNIAMGFYYNDIKEIELDTILKRQEVMLPRLKRQIRMIGEDIKRKYDNIDS